MPIQNGYHAYHLVNILPWPLTGSISAIILTPGLVKRFHSFNIYLLLLGFLATLVTTSQWWPDITREGAYTGLHTSVVITGLQWEIIFFIVSEVLLILLFFFFVDFNYFSK